MKTVQSYKRYEVEKFETIKEMLEKAVSKTPDRIAFKYRENKEIKCVTYKEFDYQVKCLGTALWDMGVADKHIAMIGVNSYKWLVTYLAVLKSPGVYVPIDKELVFGDIINIANDSDSEILFYSKKYEKDIMENTDKFPNIKYFIGLNREVTEGNFISFDELLEKGKQLLEEGKNDYINYETDPYKMKMIVYTSGTTGMAKGVMLSEHNMASDIYYGLRTSTIYTCCLSVLPYNHTYEAVVGILVALYKNVTICINDSLKAVLKNLNEYKPDYIYLVPAFTEVFYKRIWAAVEEQGKTKLIKTMIKISNGLRKVGIDLRRTLFSAILKNFGGNLREIVCGGAPIRPEVSKFFNDIGIDMINGYGITECSPLVSVNPISFNDPSTVGVPLDCVEVKIDNPNDEGIGEIIVKGDIVMMGYYKQPEMTKEVLTDDGWFSTGDYGKFTKYGQLVITGRKKNLIVLDNGKNIYPEEIEDYIQSVPYIKEVVVFGVKNELGLEDRIAAEVYLDPEQADAYAVEDVKAKVKSDIIAICSELPAYKKVSEVFIRDKEFVKTTTNKIRRNSVEANK